MLVMPTTFFDADKFAIADHLDRGCVLMRHNLFAEAIVEFDEVLKLDPKERYACWNRVLARLSLGDYTKGLSEFDCAWDIYDWRKAVPGCAWDLFSKSVSGNNHDDIDRVLRLPVWRGGRCRLIVYHEMGFGDAIMALRFLPELVRRCQSVTLVVHPVLASLMRNHGAKVISSVPVDVSEFDARVTFFNSIFTMGYSIENIPNKPYIESKFKFCGGRMGIAWSGYSRKEFDLTRFLSYLEYFDFELYALQRSDDNLFDRNIVPLQARDFKETAELMMTLDCIVTVDTAAAHLAGAIGHPSVHLLLPYFRDWRWWHKDVWYPTINIYPQYDPDNWDAPFERVNEAIHGIG